jgi:hypothetical protein
VQEGDPALNPPLLKIALVPIGETHMVEMIVQAVLSRVVENQPMLALDPPWDTRVAGVEHRKAGNVLLPASPLHSNLASPKSKPVPKKKLRDIP